MAAVRAVLIALVILALAVSPLAVPLFGGSSPGDATAYASFVGGARADRAQAPAMQDDDDDNGSNDNDDEDDDNGDGNGNDNDDGNDNDGGDDDDGNDNDGGDDDGGDDDDDNGGDDDDGGDNGNDNVVVIVRTPNESVNRPTKCFDTREVGVVQLGTGSYDVTVTVMPHSSFNQTTRLTLHSVDPATGQSHHSGSAGPGPLPALPGSLVDSVVFDLDAQSSCDGAAINPLPNLVNMGIVYNVPNAVDKSKLQIVRLEGNSWVNVDTIPDPVPGNPYVSATVNMAGTYALIQRP